MTHTARISGPVAVALLATLLAGCNTPATRPPPPPPPPPPVQQPPPQQSSAQSEAESSRQAQTREQQAAQTEAAAQQAAERQAQAQSQAEDQARIATEAAASGAAPTGTNTAAAGEPPGSPDQANANAQAAGGDQAAAGAPPPLDEYGVWVSEIPEGETESAAARQAAEQRPESGSYGQAQTAGERVAGLDQQLDQRLSSFDDMMRRAREAAAREAAIRKRQSEQAEAAGRGGRGGEFDRPGGDAYRGLEQPPGLAGPPSEAAGDGQDEGRERTQSGGGNLPPGAGRQGEGDFRKATAGGVPKDLANARDDDIVARQLREAATRETDPVLRDKLWEEYRRYKKGL